MKKLSCFVLTIIFLVMSSNWAFAADIGVSKTNIVKMPTTSPAIQNLDKQLSELELKISAAQTTLKSSEDKYYQFLKNYTPYTIIGDIVFSGNDYIIVQGSAIGGGFGLGSGYKKILNPDRSRILLNVYTGMHFFLRTENDPTYYTISIYDNGPTELQQAKLALDNSKKLLEKLNTDKIVLVEKKNGIKEMHYSNGDYYKGTFNAEGKLHGNGKYIWASGDVYQGVWINGNREGKGKLTFKSGNAYEGEFKNNLYDGYGNLKTGYHPEGTQLGSFVPAYYSNIYTGDFKEGKYHGKGTLLHNPDPLSYAFGSDNPFEYIGELKNGLFDGFGTLFNEGRAIVFEGMWEGGNPVKKEGNSESGKQEPKKWYDLEYTEKISEAYGKYSNGGVEYTAIYPLTWGKPQINSYDSDTYTETVFYYDNNVTINVYADYYDHTKKEEYLKEYWFLPNDRTKVRLKSGYEAYKTTVEASGYFTKVIKFIILDSEKAIRIEMLVYDTSIEGWKDISEELTKMIDSIEFIGGVG